MGTARRFLEIFINSRNGGVTFLRLIISVLQLLQIYSIISLFHNLVGVSNRELEEFLLSPALPVRRVFRYNRILELPVLPVINKGQHFSDPNGQKFGNSHNPELFQLLVVRLFNS